MKKTAIIFLFIVAVWGQTLTENWLPLSRSGAGTLYLNTEGIVENNSGDIYAWALQEHSRPIVIESVDGRIHKTKTYYLFNKNLRRYSFQQIIYYDDDGNVLKSFSYGNKTELESFRYNYPIIENTNEKIIYNKLIELTDTGEEKEG